MARLPIPGSDDGTWGQVLNEYLQVEHNSDGTHDLGLNDLNDVNASGATNGQVLEFNGTSWAAVNPSGGSSDPALGGDLTGTASNAQIAAGAIVDADISASAAIAQNKVADLTSDLADKQDANTNLTTISNLSPTNDDILQRKSGAWTSRTPDQLKADLTLTKSDVDLANVDNTSDLAKPISTATQTALDAKADQTATQTALDTKADQSIVVSGGTSLEGGGDLSSDRTLTLVNDSATPGNDQYYGTNATGTKGYHAMPDLDGYVQGDGIAKVTVNATAPSSPSVGDVWIST